MAEPTFSVPAKKMAMWLFIIADTATFAGCLFAYGFIRNASQNWPRPFHSITNVAVMTLILLTSSLTMLVGVRAAQAGDKAKAFRWVMITAVAGVFFRVVYLLGLVGPFSPRAPLFRKPVGHPPASAASPFLSSPSPPPLSA